MLTELFVLMIAVGANDLEPAKGFDPMPYEECVNLADTIAESYEDRAIIMESKGNMSGWEFEISCVKVSNNVS